MAFRFIKMLRRLPVKEDVKDIATFVNRELLPAVQELADGVQTGGLDGATGATGADGAPGTPGAPGAPGIPGDTGLGTSLFPLLVPGDAPEEPGTFLVGQRGATGATGSGSDLFPLMLPAEPAEEAGTFLVGQPGPQGIQGASAFPVFPPDLVSEEPGTFLVGQQGAAGATGATGSGSDLFPLCLPTDAAEEPGTFLVGQPGATGATGATGTSSSGSPYDPLIFSEPAPEEPGTFLVGQPGATGATGATGPSSSGSGSPYDPLIFAEQPADEGFPFIITQTGATGGTGPAGSGSPYDPLIFAEPLPEEPGTFLVGQPGANGAAGAQGPAGPSAFPVFPPDLTSDEPIPFYIPGANLSVLPVIQPGSFIGLQITAAAAAAAIEITGAEAGQNIRFNTWATSTAVGNQADFAVAASTTGVGLTPATLLNLQGLAMAAVPTQGELLILSPQNTSALVTLEHASASEATAARKFQNPGQLNLSLFQNENALIINDSNAGRMRVLAMGRARSAVQANSGTISPAETLNFITTPTTGTVVPTLAVAAGVMGLSYELLSATQSQLDNATVTTNPCVPSLLGFRPGLTSLTAKATVSAGTGRNQVGNYTIPLGSPVAGSTYLIWGYMTYVRGATATAHGLIFEVLLNSSVVETLTTIPAAVGSGSYGGLAFCLLTIYTTGATGTCSIQTTVLNQYRAGAAFGFDTSFSTATVAINTTGVGNPFQLSVKMDAIVAATSTNWTNAGCMRIN